MITISVRISTKLDEALDNLIRDGRGSNKVELICRAITKMVEEEAVLAVVRAEKGPFLRGDLRELMKKIK